MILLENAIKKAKTIQPINAMYEYPDAYVFTNTEAKDDETDDNEVVILKDDGKIISYSEYVMTTKYLDNKTGLKML
jgi:hypothetical protein